LLSHYERYAVRLIVTDTIDSLGDRSDPRPTLDDDFKPVKVFLRDVSQRNTNC
jgi:hypothetical protein